MPPVLRLVPFLALALAVAACDSEGSSLYDPDASPNPAPTVASVAPDGVVLAGVDVITIEGSGFSDDPALNTVVFDDGQGNTAAGEILSASTTRLEVRTPNLPNPALRLRVAVVGAQDYSNAVAVPLTPALEAYGELSRTEVPFGIAAEADGTLYLSLEDEGASVGVVRIGPDGARSDYFDSTFRWPALALAGDQLVGARRIRAVFGLPEGGSQQVLAAFQPSSLSLRAITAAPDGTVYTGGNEPVIYVIGPDGATAEVAFPAPVRALTYAAGTLYAITDPPEGETSRLLAVSADGLSLGEPTELADLLAVGNALAVAADGTVLVGLDRVTDPVVTVAPGGGADVLYPGVIAGPLTSLAYGAGSQLYAVRAAAGDEPASLLRIETRLDGAR